MSTRDTHSQNPNANGKGKDTKEAHAKQLFQILHKVPISRRMAATYLGYTDQTYMVTQLINDWLKSGRAEIVGSVKCERSFRLVEAVTTNSDFFIKKKTNQLKMF